MYSWMRAADLRRAWISAGLAFLLAAPAGAAELYVRGDIGVSYGEVDASGYNEPVDTTNDGSSDDASPIYGAALGVAFELDDALPWRWRTPEVRIPYWPGRALEFGGSEESRFPSWPVQFELEYLQGRSLDLSTASFSPTDPYRSVADSWSLMGVLRLDMPVRPAVQKFLGRVPSLDPMTIYLGTGAGLGITDLKASLATASGSESASEFAWQMSAGIGYQISDNVRWRAGWRYYDLGSAEATLRDLTDTVRGSYEVDLTANEFTTSLTLSFWRFNLLAD